MTFVQQDRHLTIHNIYRSDTNISLPSLEAVGISLSPLRECWLHSPPFLFKYKLANIVLFKIQIVKRPYQDEVARPWRYEVIAVFDNLIAIVQAPLDKKWNILSNPKFEGRDYVDSIGIPGYGTSSHLHRVYTVTYPYGDVLVWEPYT